MKQLMIGVVMMVAGVGLAYAGPNCYGMNMGCDQFGRAYQHDLFGYPVQPEPYDNSAALAEIERLRSEREMLLMQQMMQEAQLERQRMEERAKNVAPPRKKGRAPSPVSGSMNVPYKVVINGNTHFLSIEQLLKALQHLCGKGEETLVCTDIRRNLNEIIVESY